MAKQINGKHVSRARVKHPGIASKNNQSFNKGCSKYIKKYNGQGRP